MKIPYRMRRRFRDALLLFLTVLIISQPLTVSAYSTYSPEQEAIDALVDAGEAYIDHVGGAMLYAASSVKRIDAINSLTIETLSEGSLVQARQDLWGLARSLALAIGGSTELSQSVSQLGLESIDALDVKAEAQAGVPEETRSDLVSKAGLSVSQVDGIEAELAGRAERRFALATGGLPAQNVSQLSDAGFTTAEIDEVESALRSWGVVDSSLSTSLEQFDAARDEFAAGRSQALVGYVQLLGKQILVRQANGIEPRAVTQEELDSLAQDELRLLIHAVHLQELWGDDPRLQVGEGDWWFIERYATRSAERLEEIILDSQNRGLVAELLFILHFASLAETARAGDPQYVKNELDGLVELLSFETDAQAFVSNERVQTHGIAKLAARLVSSEPVRQHIEWSLERSAIDRHAKSIQDRLDKTAHVPPADQVGAIEELDETNNQKDFLFAAGLEFWGQLEVDILLAALDILEFINDGSMLAWIKAILTGDTETPAQFGASVLFGLIPVLGSIQDIYTLVTESGIFVKALAIVGIIGGLGELLALIGIEPAAGASFLGNAASKVMKGLFKLADEIAQFVLNSLKLRQAFNVILEFLEVAFKGIKNLGGSLDEVITFVRKLLTGEFRLWDNFIAFVRRVGADTLVKMGFDEGGDLVGRILRQGADLSDEAIGAIDEVGDSLASIGAHLGDDAADGLGLLSKGIEPERFRRLVGALGGSCGIALIPYGITKLAKLRQLGICDPELFERVLGSISEWDDLASTGFEKLAKVLPEEELGNALIKYADEPGLSKRVFAIASDAGEGWTREAGQGILKATDELGIDFAEGIANYSDEVAAKTFEIYGGSVLNWSGEKLTELSKVVDKFGVDDVVTNRIGSLQNVDGIDELVNKILTNTGEIEEYALFELELAAEIGPENIARVSDVIDGKEAADIVKKSGRIIEAKSYNWENMKDMPDFLVEDFIEQHIT
ncbi:MAG: hypothetical protein PVG04_12070, partial [Anaerolineales bacterium]